MHVLAIGARGLGLADEVDAELSCPGFERHGLDAGTWCPYGGPADEPPDQRDEDARSLCLTSEPLSERLELLGRPVAVLELTADKPLALVAVRLCDVAPDGTSHLSRAACSTSPIETRTSTPRPCRRASASSRGSS